MFITHRENFIDALKRNNKVFFDTCEETGIILEDVSLSVKEINFVDVVVAGQVRKHICKLYLY
jgi:hypothetical protein